MTTSPRPPSRPGIPHQLRPEATTIALSTRHLFGLQRVDATVRLRSGTIWLSADGDLLGMEAEMDATSFDSGSAARDRAVLSPRFLDAHRHPLVTFRSIRVPPIDGVYAVAGELTVRGRPGPVTLMVAPSGPDTLGAEGTARVDRRQHGITAARGLAARHLNLRVTTTAEPVTTGPTTAQAVAD